MDIVICRPTGGIGDIAVSLGGAQRLKELQPELKLHYLCKQPFLSLLEHHPIFEGLHPTAATLPPGAAIVDLSAPYPENVEHNPATRHLSRIQIFALRMGINDPDKPRIYLTKAETNWARAWLKDQGFDQNPIMLVWRTASNYKNYPYVERLHQLLTKKFPVLILEHELKVPGPSTKGLTLRQQAALVSLARIVIAPDTGPMHLAGLLGTPIFGLYGSQNPYTRQVPYGVPGSWMIGGCPYGKHHCLERVCGDPFATPPCMYFSAEATAVRIIETIQLLKK